MIVDELLAPRWGGEPDRVEVWYLTATDEATGDGMWIHAETVAPDGDPLHREPYAHGWMSLFPASGEPTTVRFGPVPVSSPPRSSGVQPAFSIGLDSPGGGSPSRPHDGANASATVRIDVDRWLGSLDGTQWDLGIDDAGNPPLFTFDRLLWRRPLLPGCQIVPVPNGRISGTVTTEGTTREFRGPVGIARIFGHGNAKKWAWLHADLGTAANPSPAGVLEIVAATSRSVGMDRLPPLAVARLRVPGHRDWPRSSAAMAVTTRTKLGEPAWQATMLSGRRRLRVNVEQPPSQSVALTYRDPDGATATCTNSCVASAEIVAERWSGRWRVDDTWELHGTAHAEFGTRP